MQHTINYNLNKPELTDVADITKISDNMDIIDGLFKGIIDKLYPVNSIYLSTDSTNPGTVLGIGTWVMIEQGRMLRSAGSDITAGSTGGADTVTLETENLPAHSHTASSNSQGAHTHTITVGSGGAHNHTASTGGAGKHNHTTSSAGSHSHTVTGGNDDDHSGHFTIGNGTSLSATTNSAGAHTHTISTENNHTHTVTVQNAAAHTHSGSSASSGAHTHTITVGDTGSGTAVNVVNKYYAVYMWRRTA